MASLVEPQLMLRDKTPRMTPVAVGPSIAGQGGSSVMTDSNDTTPKTAPRRSLSRAEQERRQILRSVAIGGAMVCASMAGFFKVKYAQAAPHLRPPGALDEKRFLAACIKCGQCVQVCPVQAIKLADIQEGVGNGVPYIDARDQACDFSCDADAMRARLPDRRAEPLIDKKEQTRMGVAELPAPDACLAPQGKGFKGQARGENSRQAALSEIDRWKPRPVASITPMICRSAICACANARSRARSRSSRLVRSRRQAPHAGRDQELRRLRRLRDDLPGRARRHRIDVNRAPRTEGSRGMSGRFLPRTIRRPTR
jgi:ferredoxin-type protein NapG